MAADRLGSYGESQVISDALCQLVETVEVAGRYKHHAFGRSREDRRIEVALHKAMPGHQRQFARADDGMRVGSHQHDRLRRERRQPPQ